MSLSDLKVTRSALTKALIAGMIMAVVSVPGAIANGLLAGVNPIYGVYSMIAGTTVAAFFTSSVWWNIGAAVHNVGFRILEPVLGGRLTLRTSGGEGPPARAGGLRPGCHPAACL